MGKSCLLIALCLLGACGIPTFPPLYFNDDMAKPDAGPVAPEPVLVNGAPTAPECVPFIGQSVIGDGSGPCGCVGMPCCKFQFLAGGCDQLDPDGNALHLTCDIFPGPNVGSCQPCGGIGQLCCLPGDESEDELCNAGLTCGDGVYGRVCKPTPASLIDGGR